MSRSATTLALLLSACTSGLVETSEVASADERLSCVAGTPCEPHRVTELPFEADNDLFESNNNITGYDCSDEAWNGPERIYAFHVVLPSTLKADLDAAEGVGLFVVHVDDDHNCVTGGGATLDTELEPGLHWVVVDSSEDVEDGAFALSLDTSPIVAEDDRFEPNDTYADTTTFTLEHGDEVDFQAKLTFASPIDYFTFEMEQLAQFDLEIDGDGLEVEVVTWDGPYPEHDESWDGNHSITLEDWGRDGSDYPYGTVTVSIEMTAEAWEKGGTSYQVHATHTDNSWN